jgi:phasin family protein
MNTMDSSQSFLNTDFSKAFLNPNLSKAFAGFTLPGFDAETVLAYQRRNIEALTQATQLATQSFQTVVNRQMEIAREVIDEASALARDLMQPIAPEARVAKNAEIVKQVFEKGLAHARELTGTLAKAHTEAFDVITKRVSEGLDEIKATSKSAVAKGFNDTTAPAKSRVTA